MSLNCIKYVPAVLLLLAACTDWPSLPREQGVRVSVAEAETSRTLFPDSSSWTYALAFESLEGQRKEGTLGAGASGFVVLPAGLWNLSLSAKDGSRVVAEGNVQNIEVNDGITTNVRVALEVVLGETGTLAWSVDYPEGLASAYLYLTGGGSPNGFPLNLSSITPTGTLRSGTVSLASGSWLLRARLEDNAGITAGRTDAVHIYPGQTTRADYVFTAGEFTPEPGYPPLILSADTMQNTYTLIASKGYGYESPEQTNGGHAGTPHITQEYNAELGKDVFAFALHLNQDGNSTGDQTRQRLELKVDNDDYRGKEGRSFVYRWKFKLPADFAPSTDFTHIHQIKNEGGDSSSPIITLTPRLVGSNKQMQLIYRAPTYNYGSTPTESSPNCNLKQVSLDDFLGKWVQAEEALTYSADPAQAAYRITITRIEDNKVLLSYTHSAAAYGALESNTTKWPFVTWRATNTYGRPKYGIYRLIWKDAALTNPVPGLKDETLLYADFELSRMP